MNGEYVAWVGAVAVLLIVGLLIGQQFLAPPDDAGDIASFRQWFWESRSLDLAAQVGLIFVAALGIATLLPRNREDGE